MRMWQYILSFSFSKSLGGAKKLKVASSSTLYLNCWGCYPITGDSELAVFYLKDLSCLQRREMPAAYLITHVGG